MKKNAPKFIEIDDSGYGSLYGGIIILVTTGKKDYSEEVPIKHFAITDKNERKDAIYKSFTRIIKSGLKKLNADPNSTIVYICQGNTFDYSSIKLIEAGYLVVRKKIEGRTNNKAEQLFKKLLSDKYKIKNYSPKDYKKESLRQYQLLRTRRDFKNVKRNSRGVKEIETSLT